jgi:hypothetical protein
MAEPQVEPLPKKKRKKGEKTKRTDECDKLFGMLVRGRGACVVCGSFEFIQAAHGFSRSYRAVRWDDRNCFPLCRADHVRYTHRPLEWDVWLRERWGALEYEAIREQALTHQAPDMDELVLVLRERVKREATA